MDISSALHFFMSLDESLIQLVQDYGIISYLVLFLVIFLETGIVIAPLLPGDSLLFAAGAVAAVGGFNIFLLVPLLFAAAVVGDGVNYLVGKTLGRRIVEYAHHKNFLINYSHISATEAFFRKHGGKSIILARFMPIIRTFAPFVAGVGRMDYRNFAIYNVSGAALWVLLLTLAGYWFGNIPIVKANFELVIVGIIIVSLLPAIIHWIKNRFF